MEQRRVYVAVYVWLAPGGLNSVGDGTKVT
jgi:hypothetical protein